MTTDMLRKKEAFTVVTPIPGFIPRQLAIDILHSHSEVINVNPLVLGHKPIAAPRTAASDEFYSTWYEIEERVQFVPGMGKIGSGKISFKGCFHDMPWGLQTHIYAPLHIDLRNTYRIAGNQPGVEPPELREIGLENLGAPADGLYLREDIEIKCNIAMVSFVKAQLKAACKEMVHRIIKKAELLDAGVLKAMIEDGRLKTFNPNDRSSAAAATSRRLSDSQATGQVQPYTVNPTSPRLSHTSPYPNPYSPTYPPYAQSMSMSPQLYNPHNPYQQGFYAPPQMAAMELPGDFVHPQPSPQMQVQLQPPPARLSPGWGRDSVMSSDPRWSHPQLSPSLVEQNRLSMTSSVSSSPGLHPGPGFASELAAHNETKEEHQVQVQDGILSSENAR